ncbi:MAG: cadmium-translocating P-type ATPase [Oscillospiraceae bacterium]|nr:cadmium-translocating P-type ATPase [Oscillospiraceae bacterium]
MKKKQKKMLLRIILSAAATAALQFLPLTGLPRLLAYLAVYLLIGYDILKNALRGIANGRVFDENFLMAIATVGAFALAIYSRSGDYLEAIAVMLFYQTGELFQSIAVGKSRKSIGKLMDIRPDYANIELDGTLQQIDPGEVAVGTVIVVQPGEKIPLDGIVESGSASLDTRALTGESLPRDAGVGDSVVSGCVCLDGVLHIRTTREFGESTVSKILELVENASSRKAKSENFISRFARIYTPAVCIAALGLAVLPPVVGLALGGSGDWATWLYRALTFLVTSCPCALVISIPLTFFAAIGGASRQGILVKGANYLETLAGAKRVVFDKTGTLTQGVFRVSEVLCEDMAPEKLLEYAALAECASSHPISLSLQAAYGRPIDRSRVTDISERSGYGVLSQVDGKAVAAGSRRLLEDLGIPCPAAHDAGTVVLVAVDGKYAGRIVISDALKPGAADAIALLKKAGVRSIVMLTGDSPAAAGQVAQALGIGQYRHSLLPADKVSAVEEMLQSAEGPLVFVGDGINDAPVLARADVGIAMGALGSDAAIEASDVVLMDDDLRQLPKAIGLARRCRNIVYQNIIFSLAVKFGCLTLVALGMANMWLAIFADVGVMVLAVLNAIRALGKAKQ